MRSHWVNFANVEETDGMKLIADNQLCDAGNGNGA